MGNQLFFAVFLICVAYCYDYQRTMYEMEKQQMQEMLTRQEEAVRN